MNDLTILYYSACRVPQVFATNVRTHLRCVIGNTRVISISFKRIYFGDNICIGQHEPHVYTLYQQILIGAMMAETPYVACCEDDSLYTEEHLSFRPPLDAFAYNVRRYQANQYSYYYRERAGMCMCIAPRNLLVQSLCKRFAHLPEKLPREKLVGFGEPGRKDHLLGLENPSIVVFKTETPTITFNHRASLGGVRRQVAHDVVSTTDPYWGDAAALWKRMHE